MLFPEALYLLSQRDQQVTWLDPRIANTQASGGAAVTLTVLTVPIDRVFLLFALVTLFEPEAALSTLSRILMLNPPGAAVADHRFHSAETDVAAGVKSELNFQGELIVPPGWRIDVRGQFSGAGAGGNVVNGWATGMLIPAGNVARL